MNIVQVYLVRCADTRNIQLLKYIFRYILFNVPVHANATIPLVQDMFSASSFLSQVHTSVLESIQSN